MRPISQLYPSAVTDASPIDFSALPGWRLSAYGLFPSLLISSSLIQPGFPFLFNLVGQLASIFSIMAACVIVYLSFREKHLILLIIGGVLMMKSARILIGDENIYILLGYTLITGFLFCLAGAAIALHKSNLLYCQVMFFCLISIPLLIFQVAGIGKWAWVFRLEFYQGDLTLVPTVFQNNTDIIAAQVRPGGFLYTNVFLAAVILLALGLHFGRIAKHRSMINDAVLCAIIVLAMAKIVFLAFGLFTFWFLIFGDGQKRKRMLRILFFFSFFSACYAFFFPAAFAYNTSWPQAKINFLMRLHGMTARIQGYTLTEMQYEDESGQRIYRLGDDPQSGYGTIGMALPYLAVAALLMLPFYIKQFRNLKRYFPELKDQARLFLVLAALGPISASITGANIYWFLMGFGLLPLFLALKPYAFQSRRKKQMLIGK